MNKERLWRPASALYNAHTMAVARYEFVTIWKVDAPLQAVWDAIYQSEDWPHWWRGVERVEELQAGDDLGVGAVHRYTWKSKLPYRLRFDMRTVAVEPGSRLEGEAIGELTGYGKWTFTRENGLTVARYDWNVATTRAWMNVLAPVARPVFRWNHDVVMAWGREGLEKHLQGGREAI